MLVVGEDQKPSDSEPDVGNFNPGAFFSDTCVEFNGCRPPTKVIKRVAVEAKKLKDSGVNNYHLKKGIQILIDGGMDPSHLPECVFRAQSRPHMLVGPAKAEYAAESALLRELLDKNDGRWPTGARMVRGSHAGQMVYDPLGYERRPEGFPYPKPSREEVLGALRDAPHSDV